MLLNEKQSVVVVSTQKLDKKFVSTKNIRQEINQLIQSIHTKNEIEDEWQFWQSLNDQFL